MKLFARSTEHWIIWTFIVHAAAFYLEIMPFEYIYTICVLVMNLPLWVNPLAHWLNAKSLWQSD